MSEEMNIQTLIRQKSKRQILLKALRRKFVSSGFISLGIFSYFVLRIAFLTGEIKLWLIVLVFLVLLMNWFLVLLFLFLSELLQLFRLNRVLANFGLWFIALVYCLAFRQKLPFTSDIFEVFIRRMVLQVPGVEILQYLALLAGLTLVILYYSDRVECYD
ncbi:hypothetical protein [Lactovum odontotermitis]